MLKVCGESRYFEQFNSTWAKTQKGYICKFYKTGGLCIWESICDLHPVQLCGVSYSRLCDPSCDPIDFKGTKIEETTEFLH